MAKSSFESLFGSAMIGGAGSAGKAAKKAAGIGRNIIAGVERAQRMTDFRDKLQRAADQLEKKRKLKERRSGDPLTY